MRKNISYYNTPSFSPGFDTNSEQGSSQCSTCIHYEQDIAILQKKLQEIHNKLLDQIDINREKQIQISQLYESIMRLQEKLDAKRQKSPGRIIQGESTITEKSMQHHWQTKNQLLKNDLEGMRKKVVSEITRSNKLKEKLDHVESKHQQEINEYKQKIKKIQLIRNKLIHENEQLCEDNRRAKQLLSNYRSKNKKCECGFQNKYFELDEAFMNQRTITTQLIEENNQLQNKIYELQAKMEQTKGGMRNVGSFTSSKASALSNINDRIQNDRNRQILIVDGYKKEHRDYREVKQKNRRNREKKKADFEQTKNLIMKLEEAQRQIRSRK